MGDLDADRLLRQLHAIVSQIPDALVAVDSDLRITEWNLAAERLFGWSREELLGRELARHLNAEVAGPLQNALERGEAVSPYETVAVHRDGGRRLITVQPAPLCEGDDEVGGVTMCCEVPESKRLERQLGDLLGAMPVMIVRFDADATVTYTAGGGFEHPGARNSLSIGTNLRETLGPDSPLHVAVEDALSGRAGDIQLEVDDLLWQCHFGSLVDRDAQLLGSTDARAGGFLSAFDVTSEHVVADRLAEVLAASPIALTAFDAAGMITYAAGSGYASLGINPDDTLGQSLLSLYGGNLEIAHALHQCLAGTSSDVVLDFGGRIWERWSPYPGPDGGVSGGICISLDATAWLGAQLPESPEDRAADRADTAAPPTFEQFQERDDVTGLLGRRGLQRRLSEPVDPGSIRAVAVLDVDAFSLVNETYGTTQADRVLRALGDRLKRECGETTVGRWHADEFVIILDASDAGSQLESLTTALLQAARVPLVVGDLVVHLGLSAGLVSSEQAPTFDLVAAARQALRAAKHAGRDRFEWYSPQMAQAARGTGMGLAEDLRVGIRAQQLRLHYQPIIELVARNATGVEALVRWQHPIEGLLWPTRFLEMTERTGQIVALGQWVLEQACACAAELVDSDTGLQTVAVNLAAQQLADTNLVEQVAAMLEKTGCPPSALELEVTETAVMADMTAATRILHQLKGLGVQIALDDFGTGYSSLLYLKHFPVDKLKIDQSFVSGLGTPDDSAIVASTISLAHTMNIVCVAEGVETIDQLTLLQSMSCDYAQGYLFSRPLPMEALQTWLFEQSGGYGAIRRAAPEERGLDVDRILQMHAEAASLQTIAATLNADGRRTSRGSRWTAKSVARVIARKQYPSLEVLH